MRVRVIHALTLSPLQHVEISLTPENLLQFPALLLNSVYTDSAGEAEIEAPDLVERIGSAYAKARVTYWRLQMKEEKEGIRFELEIRPKQKS